MKKVLATLGLFLTITTASCSDNKEYKPMELSFLMQTSDDLTKCLGKPSYVLNDVNNGHVWIYTPNMGRHHALRWLFFWLDSTNCVIKWTIEPNQEKRFNR